MKLDELGTPALVVDLDRLERNIVRMADRASQLGVRLRPHVKTHKCLEIGRLQLAAGASGITVSTLEEARAFSEGGFDDITWAFPIIPGRCEEAAVLAARISFGVVVDSCEAVAALVAAGFPFKTWLKVDCGYHRAGVSPEGEELGHVARAISEGGLRFAGVLSHSGNAYDETTEEGRAAVAETERATLVRVAARLAAMGLVADDLSVGSTPSMTAVTSLAGVTEARPGNYAYFDRMQVALGACSIAECAVSVLSTVVSSAAEHSICDAGALVLSQDPGQADGSMGEVWSDYDGDRLDPRLRVVSLSQEHGRLSRAVPVGTRLRILPNHSCLTAACFATVHAVRGDEVETSWKIWNSR